MKPTRIFVPALLSVLSLTMVNGVHAETTIKPADNGNLSVTGMIPDNGCNVLFSPQGRMIEKGNSCSSKEINKAQKAINSYVREQNLSVSDEHPSGGYADSEAGGPDYWEISGVANNDLGLKAKPSLDAAFTVRGLHNGTILRNLGCKNHNGDRWCRVEVKNNTSQTGWVRTQYLRKSNGDRRSNGSNGYADGDAGGPDYWEATNFNADFLGLRRKPDQDAQIDARVKKGTILRNLGCKKHDDVRWCQVQVKDKPDQKGWVKGEYLCESSGSH
jgi:SH3-like domain-containing protein